jgi:hypothetical protein
MRRLAARRTGGAPDNKPGTGRHPVALLAGGLVAGLLLVAGTVVLWPRDRPATPADQRLDTAGEPGTHRPHRPPETAGWGGRGRGPRGGGARR